MTPLTDEFFDRVNEYIARLEDRIKSAEGVMLDLLKREHANVLAMVDDIKTMRREKVAKLWAGGGKVDIAVLTTEERAWFTGSLKQRPEPEVAGGELAIVCFLKEIPEIIGSDFKHYGPFRPEDVASLPTEIATPLITRGYVVKFSNNKAKGIIRDREPLISLG